MEQKTVKDRTVVFIKSKRLKINEFERMCGLSAGYISTMRRGFGTEKLMKVLNTFPDLNRDWLLYGEGDMLKSNLANKSSIQQTNIGDNNTYNANIDVTLVQELSKAHDIATKAQEHVDKLLSLIDKITSK